MGNFEFWKMAYRMGWATPDQVELAVTLGLLTEAEKLQILS